MTVTLRKLAPSPVRRGGRSREAVLFLAAIAVLALHVLDDNFLQPNAGTSAGDHLVSGLVPLSLLGLAAWWMLRGSSRPRPDGDAGHPCPDKTGLRPLRLRGGARGALALVLGLLGIAGGIEGYHYAREVGASGDDFTSLLCFPAGLLLIGLGAVIVWRSRGGGSWRQRGLVAVATFFLAPVVVAVGVGYGTTHVGRAVVPPDHLGVPHEDVRFTTSDGLELEGWYIPSRNGAAVIAFPSRKGPQRAARMLARHGYGVLLFDRRGEGRSEGDPNSWGWGGDRDVKAAIEFLQQRPDVDPDRIGGIGLSVGGEMMIETAAETDELKAVVSEGAGARSTTEDMDHDDRALGKWTFGLAMSAVKTAAVAVSSNHSPPANLKDLAAKVEQPLLLIAAPNSPNGEKLNRGYHAAAGENSTLWEIPESKHVGGLAARPDEYEKRVVGFFDEALRP
jgi:dienelactone hydrolase